MTSSAGSITSIDPDGDLLLHLPPPSSRNSSQKYTVHVLVSSKHMSLASPVFKAMLTGGFQEAVELKAAGKTEIPLPDEVPHQKHHRTVSLSASKSSLLLLIGIQSCQEENRITEDYYCLC